MRITTALALGSFIVLSAVGTARADQPHHAHGLEHPQPIRVAEAGEAVAREQRLLDPFDPILPSAASLPEGQERVDPGPVGKLRVHLLLVSRASAHRVPARLERRILGPAWLLLGGRVAAVAAAAHFCGSAMNVVPVRVVLNRIT